MKQMKKMLSLLLLTALLFGVFGAAPFDVAAAGGISYVKRAQSDGAVTSTSETCTDYININSVSSDELESGKWYVVTEDTTLDDRLYLKNGTANLILCDNATLTANAGFGVSSGATFNIYGQSGDTGTLYTHYTDSQLAKSAALGGTYGVSEGNAGRINIFGGTFDLDTSGLGAGIGGASGGSPFLISIYGGNIKSCAKTGAGIGGGDNASAGDYYDDGIVIYGGTVEAVSNGGAGIGNGLYRDDTNNANNALGSIKIYGGKVTALSTDGGAGIGGGRNGENLQIDIYGGDVTGCARGEESGAGIGSGSNASQNESILIYGGTITGQSISGAGIGSGLNRHSGTISISDASVFALSTGGGAGIGSGRNGNSRMIYIEDATVAAVSSNAESKSELDNIISSVTDTLERNESLAPHSLPELNLDDIVEFLYDSFVFDLSFFSGLFSESSREGFGAGIGGGDKGNSGSIHIERSNVSSHGAHQGAGIGSGKLSKYGDIMILESMIDAVGGGYAAGIGGGNESKPDGTIFIEDSTVNAVGGTDAAGIGTGNECGKSGTIRITGSTVSAHGGAYGAGIGGGDAVSGGSISISDHSDVHAYGGKDAAGIGGGEGGNGGNIEINDSTVYAKGNHYGAGIGGGEYMGLGGITIMGDSVVEAYAGESGNGVAFGNGDYNTWLFKRPSLGTMTLSPMMIADILYNTGGTAETVSGQVSVEKAMHNSKFTKVYTCPHPNKRWVAVDMGAHAEFCNTCGNQMNYDSHNWDENYKCTVCGASAVKGQMTIVEQNNSGEVNRSIEIPLGTAVAMPQHQVAPDGKRFSYWTISTDDDFHFENENISFHSDVTVTAHYFEETETTYIDQFGGEQTVTAGKITSADLQSDILLTAGWYVVDEDIISNKNIYVDSHVNLILADGKTLQLTNYSMPISNRINARPFSAYLYLYGQSEQTGTLKFTETGFRVGTFIQYGGIVDSMMGVSHIIDRIAGGKFYSEEVTQMRMGEIIGGNTVIDNYNVNNQLTLGWTNPTDSIRLNTLEVADYTGSVKVADGQILKDEDGTLYSGTLSSSEINYIQGRTLTPYTTKYSVKKVWDTGSNLSLRPDSVKAVIQQNAHSNSWYTVQTVTLNEENGWQAEFDTLRTDAGDVRIRELGPDKEDGSNGDVIYQQGDPEYLDTGEDDKRSSVTYSFTKGGTDYSVKYRVAYTEGDDNMTTITNTMDNDSLSVEKKWDIDLEGNDHPDSVQMLVQKNQGGSWTKVALATLSEDNDWKSSVEIPQIADQGASVEYRVRELREESLYNEFMGSIKDLVTGGKDTFDEWVARFKLEQSDLFYSLPDAVLNAIEQGYDALLDSLNAKPNELYAKLVAALEFESCGNRVVYDKNDDDKPSGEKTNRVTYNVGSYTSVVSGGTVDAHTTTYQVGYENDGNHYTVTNQALQVIDLRKWWLKLDIGDETDDEDMPDSAWLVLMSRPKSGAVDAASDIASAAGVDLGGILDYDFPVLNPLEGGNGLFGILGDALGGIDLGFIDSFLNLPTVAIGRVTEDDGWKKTIVDTKYTCGIPKEFRGAELSSEILRQLLKYVTNGVVDLPFSYNPFDNYISIPTKAIPAVRWLDIGDLDMSALIAAGKRISREDLENLKPADFVFDKNKLMANVINVRLNIGWDDDEDDTLHGKKIWQGDTEANRPEWLKIHIKDGGVEIPGSPVTLNKSSFSGSDTWSWSLELADGIRKRDLTVSEEYPANYAAKDHYSCIADGVDLTNIWSDDKVTVAGRKIWQDNDDADGIRPESITVHLLADGAEVSSVVVNKQCGWKYFFPLQPLYKTGENNEKVRINYTVREDPVEGYTPIYDGYDIINRRTAPEGKLTITATRDNTDREQSFVYRVSGANDTSLTAAIVLRAGESTGSVTLAKLPSGNYTVTEESDWSWRYSDAGTESATVGTDTAEVTFDHTLDHNEWLSGCSHRIN